MGHLRAAKKNAFGIFACIITTALAIALHYLRFWPFMLSNGQHPIDTMALAIVLGFIIRNFLYYSENLSAGLHFCSKAMLYTAIVFLGAKLNIATLFTLSWDIFFIIVLCLLFGYFFSIFIGKKLNSSDNINTLIAFGTTICGSSAIAAICPLIKANKQETAVSLASINLFGTLAIFIFPLIGHAIALTSTQFALWAGTSIQAVPQVVASSFIYSHFSGILGTTVKLVRVLFLAPMFFLVLYDKKQKSM